MNVSEMTAKINTTSFILNDFTESIIRMEQKFTNMENEIFLLNEKRKKFEKNQSSALASIESQQQLRLEETTEASEAVTTAALSEKSQFEKFTKQIQLLEDTNKNLSEDLVEWKNAFLEKANECELNREKYLQTQNLYEEQQRQMLKSSIDNDRNQQQNQFNANCNNTTQGEVDNLKQQLKDFGHLTLKLETKQMELHEAQSKLKIAEKTIKALSEDLESCISKYELYHNEAESEKAEKQKIITEKENLLKEIVEWKLKYDYLEKENNFMAKNLDKIKFLENCLDIKTREYHEQNELLDKLREENAKNISRVKERAEVQKRAFQTQIYGLENELMHVRNSVSTIYKERDDMKIRLQNEITNLEQKFYDSQMEIKNLHSRVDILKTSYANILDDFDKDDENSD